MGVYPNGFPDWEVTEIEKFRESHPALYEWRKTAHLIPENLARPIGASSPAKAGVQSRCDTANALPRALFIGDCAPAFAGERDKHP